MGAAEKREPGDLLTTSEVARLLRLKPGSVLSLVSRGKLVPDHRGRRGGLHGHRFSMETVQKFLKGGSDNG